jgi:hypothetical protein
MLNIDMIGNSSSSETNLHDNMRVRVFSEEVPAYETKQMEALRKYTSAENDRKARQLAPYEPANCGIVINGLTNKTTLRWETPSKGQKPSGYYVLMRDTYQPFWERKIFVTGTEVTLPYSKDNYFFGIQSVDPQGHESLPVFPGQAKRSVSQNSK